MPALHHYLISYDISDTRRRFALVRLLKRHGVRIQKSVFECQLTEREASDLRAAVLALCQPDAADRLCFYSLCQHCEQKRISIGALAQLDRKGYFVV